MVWEGLGPKKKAEIELERPYMRSIDENLRFNERRYFITHGDENRVDPLSLLLGHLSSSPTLGLQFLHLTRKGKRT